MEANSYRLYGYKFCEYGISSYSDKKYINCRPASTSKPIIVMKCPYEFISMR